MGLKVYRFMPGKGQCKKITEFLEDAGDLFNELEE